MAISKVEGFQNELHELRMAVERDRTLWHSRMDTMEMAVEETLELVQEVRFAHNFLLSPRCLYTEISKKCIQRKKFLFSTNHSSLIQELKERLLHDRKEANDAGCWRLELATGERVRASC